MTQGEFLQNLCEYWLSWLLKDEQRKLDGKLSPSKQDGADKGGPRGPSQFTIKTGLCSTTNEMARSGKQSVSKNV